MLLSSFLPISEKLLNQYLAQDQEKAELLNAYSGKVIYVQLEQPSFHFYFIINKYQLQLRTDYADMADVIIQGTPFAMARLLMSKNQGIPQDIKIIGDIALAQTLKKVLSEIEIDWEEKLTLIFGDVIGHGLSSQWQRFRQWGKKVSHQLRRSTSEYLQEEAQLFPPALELQYFYQEVDIIRDDVARLAVRIQHLQENIL